MRSLDVGPACGIRQRRWRRLLVGAVLVAALWSTVPAAHAASERDLRRQQQQLAQQAAENREALASTSEAAKAARAQLDAITARQPQALAELQAAEAAVAAAQVKDVELAGRLAQALAQEAVASAALADGEQLIATTRSSASRVVAQAYRDGGTRGSAAILLGASSPEALADRYALVNATARIQTRALGQLQQQRAVQDNQRARVQAAREDAGRLRAQAAANLAASQVAQQGAETRKAEVDQLASAQTAAVSVLESEKARYLAEADAAEAASDDIEAELRRRAQAAAARAAADKAAAARTSGAKVPAGSAAAKPSRSSSPASPSSRVPAASTRTTSGGILGSPLSAGVTVTSPFGYRIHPVYKVLKFHSGTDMRAACGTPVYAAESGEVIRASMTSGYGNLLVIDNGIVADQPVATAYAHLSRFVAPLGSQVQRGELVAYSGSTGVGTACHLHFEVRVNGTAEDPMDGWL